MADSLVVGNIIELLGGGVPSTHPLCTGAVFYLAPGWDLSAPQPAADTVATLLLGGGLPLGQHVDNRSPVLPVRIVVPSTGDQSADRLTLAGAREVLLQAVNADRWQLVWTRDGGQSMIFDCFHAHPAVMTYSQVFDKNLASEIEVSFDAMPYGRSDTVEQIAFNSPSAGWQPPVASAVLDDFNTPDNWLSAGDSGFEAGVGNWVPTANCALSSQTAQFHSGTHSLGLTASSAAAMSAQAAPAANALTLGYPCLPGDTINVKAWLRANATGRTCQTGALFYDATGAAIGTAVLGTGTADVTTAQTQISGAVTAPALTAVAIPVVSVSAPASGELHFVDDVSIDRGPIWSSNDLTQFTAAGAGAVTAHTLRWSRTAHDCPSYQRILPAPADITGRTRFSVWVGLGTGTYAAWHAGRATCAVVLTDAAGNTLTVSITWNAKASALINSPHWQKISGLLPQTTQFDYTTLTSYTLTVWNKVEGGGVRVLQAEAYFDRPAADGSSTGTNGARGATYAVPGAVGTAPAPLSLQLQPGPSVVPTQALFTVAGSNNWTSTLTGNVVAETTAGGSGGAGAGPGGGGGGSGGEYAYDVIPVTNATVYHPVVGAGGAAGNTSTHVSGAGGDSFFTGDSGRTCRAHGGGAAGLGGTRLGGRGGTGSSNMRHFDGGDGKTVGSNTSTATRGGGGGGSGGTASDGNDAVNTPTNEWTGAPAVPGGGPGGRGGRDPLTPHTGNVPASGPGGGGGGGANSGGANAGGAGFNGQIRLSYSSAAGTPLKTAVLHLPPRDAPASLAPMTGAGNGSDTPNGATTYTAPVAGNLQARYKGTYQVLLTNFSWNSPGSTRTVTVVLTQHRGDGTTAAVTLARTLTPNTDPDPLRPLNGLVLLGTVTLPLAEISPGNNTDTFTFTVNDTNTSDRFLDLLVLDTTGQTVIYSASGSGVANLWVTEPDIGLDVGQVYGSAGDWDTADSVLGDCPVLAGGWMALMPGENPLLVYSVQGAPAVIATYQPRWWLDRLQ